MSEIGFYLTALAIEAGNIMKKAFLEQDRTRSWKKDGSPITGTDKAVQKMVMEAIHRDFPHIHVVGEEGRDDISKEEMIIFDPVDGTVSFMSGIPLFSFAIAYMKNGVPQNAVIYAPMLGLLWSAKKGQGAFLNGDRIQVSDHQEINRSTVGVVWWKGAKYNLPQVCQQLIEQGCQWICQTSLAYHGALVASGQVDGTIAAPSFAYETAALHLIIEEAGGKVTDIHGQPMQYGPNGEIDGHIISNGHMHDLLTEVVRSCQ